MNNWLSLSDVKQFEIELSSHCNARCPLCVRQIRGTDQERLDFQKGHLKISQIKKLIKQLPDPKNVSFYFGGISGDPMMNPDIVNIFKYCAEQLKILSMDTNASLRSLKTWKELGEISRKYGSTINFSIDGLEDTNHLYRIRTDWNKIIENASAFISAGGRARWDFLVFDYNEHQTEEAKRLADNWGFEKFQLKKSSRFITGHTNEKKDSHQAVNRKGEETIKLKEPTNDELKNKTLSKIDMIKEKFGSMDGYYDVSEIQCRVKTTGSIYVSAEGLILPCCWTAGRMYKWWHKDPKVEQIWDFIDAVGGKDTLNAKLHTLEEIFATGIFEKIEESWNIDGCSNGRLKVCAMKCSKEFDVVGSQYQ